jgi:acyl-CoA reductase-like NAD-dependent aldehyde dehydrogenase
MIVMPDADLTTTIPALMPSFFGNTGQRCLSGANLVAVGDVYESLKKKFVDVLKKEQTLMDSNVAFLEGLRQAADAEAGIITGGGR